MNEENFQTIQVAKVEFRWNARWLELILFYIVILYLIYDEKIISIHLYNFS